MKKMLTVLGSLAAFAGASTVFAQAGSPSVTYSPVASSIPTLGTSMLLLLALLLVVVAVRVLRGGGRQFTSLALAGGLLGLAAGGVLVVDGVRALQGGAPPVISLMNQEGGATLTILPASFDFTAQVANSTPVDQRITAISPGDCSLTPLVNAGIALPQLPEGAQDVGTCEVGLVVPSGDYCSLEFFSCPVLPNGGLPGPT